MRLQRLFGWVLCLLVGVILGKDYYEILELLKDASDKDIKLAYRQLSKKYHPDKNSSPEAHERFIEIGEAYDVLSDPEKKSNYDRHGDPNGPQQENVDFGDIFNQFFGGFGGGGGFGGQRHQGKQRGSDTHVRLHASLVDYYRGKDMEFSVEMQNICLKCDGTGSQDRKKHECPKCRGRGFIRMQRQLGPGMIQTFNTHCDECQGKGTTIKHHCHVCGGQGTVRASRNYNVYLSPGTSRGHPHVLQGEGDQSPEWIAGNLVVILEEDLGLSWGYRRIGHNLYRTEVLTAKEALSGGWKRLIPFFDSIDTTIELERSVGSVQDNEVEVIRGKGMPIPGPHEAYGDLYIQYKVLLPKEHTKNLKDEL